MSRLIGVVITVPDGAIPTKKKRHGLADETLKYFDGKASTTVKLAAKGSPIGGL